MNRKLWDDGREFHAECVEAGVVIEPHKPNQWEALADVREFHERDDFRQRQARVNAEQWLYPDNVVPGPWRQPPAPQSSLYDELDALNRTDAQLQLFASKAVMFVLGAITGVAAVVLGAAAVGWGAP